jgi:hypothetical protein
MDAESNRTTLELNCLFAHTFTATRHTNSFHEQTFKATREFFSATPHPFAAYAQLSLQPARSAPRYRHPCGPAIDPAPPSPAVCAQTRLPFRPQRPFRPTVSEVIVSARPSSPATRRSFLAIRRSFLAIRRSVLATRRSFLATRAQITPTREPFLATEQTSKPRLKLAPTIPLCLLPANRQACQPRT